jgi:hypothetical protein
MSQPPKRPVVDPSNAAENQGAAKKSKTSTDDAWNVDNISAPQGVESRPADLLPYLPEKSIPSERWDRMREKLERRFLVDNRPLTEIG